MQPTSSSNIITATVLPAGEYSSSGSPALIKTSATAVYGGYPAQPVYQNQTVEIRVSITFTGGSGAGQFRAAYSLKAEERDHETTSTASINFDGQGDTTFPTSLEGSGGLLPAIQFTFNQPQVFKISLMAGASATFSASNLGPVTISAWASLNGLFGYDGHNDANYDVHYTWDPQQVVVTVNEG